jgi:hypothetical protein
MTSRDFGFLSLRNTIAYQPNGLPVPPNQVLITSTNGAAVFSNSINISTINVSTLNTNTIIPSTTLTIEGNVLISTNQPGYNLNIINTDISGTILSLDHSSTQNMFRMATDTSKFIWFNSGSNPNGGATSLVPSTLQLYAYDMPGDTPAPALIVDVNGQVGIGSNSLPQAALDVTGQLRVSTGVNPFIPSIYFNNDPTTGFNSIEPGLIGILAGGLSRMLITSTNILVDISNIGNFNNNNYFSITNATINSTTNVLIYNADKNSGTNLLFQTQQNKWGIYTCSALGGPNGLMPSTLQINSNFSGTDNNVMTLQPGGNVGIRTSTPQATLDVTGNTLLSGNVLISTNQSGYNLNIINTNTSGTDLSLIHSSTQNIFRMATDTSKFIWFNSGSNPNGGATTLVPSTLQLYAYDMPEDTPVPALIVDVNGQVGIGSNSLPQAALDVTGNVYVSGTITSGGNILLNNIYDTNSTFVISNAINNPQVVNKVRVNVLAIGAGGGGGASYSQISGDKYAGGGGGSGQEITNTYYMDVTSTIQITIGSGGIGGIGGGPDIDANKRGENGGATTVKSLDGTINIYATGGNGADSNGGVNINTDFGGNGYYGGGTGGSQVELSTITGIGGASCVLYSMRYGSYRVGFTGSQYNIKGGNGDGPGGLISGGQGGNITNITVQASGGGGGSSLLGIGGTGGVDSDGVNGVRGGGGGGGAVNSSGPFGTFYYGGDGGNGCVQIQIFAL